MSTFRGSKDFGDIYVTTQSSEVSEAEDTQIARIRGADDALLARLGYKSEFKREFSVCILRVTTFISD
jgi:hypothetical protein